ncbi:MAG: type II secretion system protein M [Myxococcales bacterium]|nr:type II secretion system protein M [Myxococcales bacterium]
MAASFEGARDRWDRMNSREQRLVMVLGIALVVCLVAALVSKIQGGMESIEASNTEARKALRSLAIYRNAKARSGGAGVDLKIPEKAIALDSYLENIVSELELTSPTYPALKRTQIGTYEELSFEIEINGLSIDSLTSLLEKIESGSKLVVVKELNIDRNFRDKEKLDLDLTVATYRTPTAEGDEDKGSGEGEGS